jgi:hypothetical protein
LFIAAYDVESPESLLIELPERRAQDILNEFQNDYESMADSLQVMNKRLVLLNPVSAIFSTNFFPFRNSQANKRGETLLHQAQDLRWGKLTAFNQKRLLLISKIISKCPQRER